MDYFQKHKSMDPVTNDQSYIKQKLEDSAYMHKLNDLTQRLIRRLGQSELPKIQIKLTKISRQQILSIPVEALEVNIYQQLGHWSNWETPDQISFKSPILTNNPKFVYQKVQNPKLYSQETQNLYDEENLQKYYNQQNNESYNPTIEQYQQANENAVGYQQTAQRDLDATNQKDKYRIRAPPLYDDWNDNGTKNQPKSQLNQRVNQIYQSPKSINWQEQNKNGTLIQSGLDIIQQSPKINYDQQQAPEKEISDYEYKKTPLKQGSKAQNLNIRISPNMDEWSKLTLLQDLEYNKKKEEEELIQKSKKKMILSQLEQQKIKQMQKKQQEQEMDRQLELKMIENDMILFQKEKEKQMQRSQIARQNILDMKQQELQIKIQREQKQQLSYHNELEEQKQNSIRATKLLQAKLEEEKLQKQQHKQKYNQDLQEQIRMKEEAKNLQMKEDQYFQQITLNNLKENEERRKTQHKQLMDRYLGDYENQKSILRDALLEQQRQKDNVQKIDRFNEQEFHKLKMQEVEKEFVKHNENKSRRFQNKIQLKDALQDQMKKNEEMIAAQMQMSEHEKKVNQFQLDNLYRKFVNEDIQNQNEDFI